MISCDTYPASLTTAANLYLIHSFAMVECTNTEYTDMVLVYGEAAGNGRAARRIYQERLPYRVTPPHTLFAKVIQRLRKRDTFTVNRADCGARGGVALPTLKRTYCIALNRPCRQVPEPLRVEWMCLIVPSGRLCTSSNFALTIPRGYMQWVQPISHSVLISVCGSYTVVWKSPSFHDRYSSLMNVGSLGTLF